MFCVFKMHPVSAGEIYTAGPPKVPECIIELIREWRKALGQTHLLGMTKRIMSCVKIYGQTPAVNRQLSLGASDVPYIEHAVKRHDLLVTPVTYKCIHCVLEHLDYILVDVDLIWKRRNVRVYP